jgi:hypothetical protein
MQQPDPSAGDRARRRSLFGGRSQPAVPPPPPAALPPSAAERAEALLRAYQESVEEQLDEGLREIQHTANRLMHEIAAEVWRAAGGDKRDVAGTILHELSRDQAIRSLIAHSDERFQALAARTGRLEDSIAALAEGVRAAREAIQQATDALADSHAAADPSGGVAQMRTELNEVTRQVASAFEALAERDRAIVETVNAQIREHGELIARETARISQAMQAYVQHGVEAMGQLAGATDSQMHALSGRDDKIADRIEATIAQHLDRLAEQLQLLFDRMGAGTTSLHEEMTHLSDRIGVDARETTYAVGRLVDARVRGLGALVRSDSEALRNQIVREARGRDEAVARILDERLRPVTETLTTLATRIAAEVAGRVRDEVARAVGDRLDGAIAKLDARSDERSREMGAHVDQAVAAIDRAVARLTERTTTQMTETRRALEEGQLASGRELSQTLDGRIAALARLIRSDNEQIARRIAADQEASKQALRAMKELQASLPSEVIAMVEERLASLAESLERSHEVLAARIEHVAETIGRRQSDDIQVVIDRMGDAMHALASLGRPRERVGEQRIELT